jgi:hypothetical protein
VLGDGSQLVISYLSGDGTCYAAAGVRVEETSKSVSLTAIVRKQGTKSDCTASRRTAGGYLDLKAPLGHRKLIHTATDAGWETIISPVEGGPVR